MSRAARCGNCKQNFGSVQAAVDHSYSHEPRRKKASPGKPLWTVGYDRKGWIAEVKVGSQIERGEGAKTALPASETEVGVPADGHAHSAWWSTPCLCSCHYGKPGCDDKKCLGS